MFQISRTGRMVAGCVILAASVAWSQDAPNAPRTWYEAALNRLSEIDDNLYPPGKAVPLSDALLASMLYDTYQTPDMALQVETLAKLDMTPPASLPKTSTQVGIYLFTQLAHMQVAYAKPFAVMSAQAADDLFKQAKSPINEAAWNEMTLAHVWVRLGELDKALAMLDSTSSLYIEHRIELIRHAHAAAQIDVARKLASSTLEVIKKTNPEVDSIVAENVAELVTALLQVGDIDAARAAMKDIPATLETLDAYNALLKYDQAHGDDDAFAADLKAMVDMLAKMDEYDSNQTEACVRAAEICTKLRRDAEAVQCFDRFDQLVNQPDPPFTSPQEWANAGRVALYTTANDRTDGYLAKAEASLKADKTAKVEDRLMLDIAYARIDALRGNIESFDRRMADLNPRIKEINYFMAPYAVKAMMVELASVTRDEKIVASLKQIGELRGMGEVGYAMVQRHCRLGDLPAAWTLAKKLPDNQWRLRSMIYATHARLKVNDEAEQASALLDLQLFEDPRVAAYVMMAVGARLNGDEGFRGDPWMRGE